jgi:hypothetical protein
LRTLVLCPCMACVSLCDCDDVQICLYIPIIASHLETVMRCVESQMSIISRMRLIVNECESQVGLNPLCYET